MNDIQTVIDRMRIGQVVVNFPNLFQFIFVANAVLLGRAILAAGFQFVSLTFLEKFLKIVVLLLHLF